MIVVAVVFIYVMFIIVVVMFAIAVILIIIAVIIILLVYLYLDESMTNSLINKYFKNFFLINYHYFHCACY